MSVSAADAEFTDLPFRSLLAGDVAVVTGASQGMGAVIARDLTRCGATVALLARRQDEVERLAAELTIETGRPHLGLGVDVADPVACDAALVLIEARLGPASILVNNAGLFRRTKLGSADFRESFGIQQRTNVDGTVNMVLAALDQLRRTRGRIINVASVAAFISHTFDATGYAATKGAVVQLTKSLANDLAADGIRVNAVAPGVIETPLSAPGIANPEISARLMAHTPMRRPGRTEEISGPVIFLASTMSSYVTGTTLPVDGGFLAV